MHSFAGAAASPALFAIPAVAIAAWLLGMRQSSGLRMGLKAVSLRHMLPEMCALLGLFVCAAALIYRGKHNGFLTPDSTQQHFMDAIQNDWPVLVSADSLMVLQGMIRVVVVSSVALRAGLDRTCFAGEPAALFLLACICRLVLFGMSPVDVYHIDGPLGGVVSILVEAAAVPPLLYLTRGLAYDAGAVFRVFGLATLAALMAYSNRFDLTVHEPFQGAFWYLDFEFSLVQTLDFFAAGAFMAQALIASESGKTPPSMSFTHVFLLVQQVLPSYFFVYALAPPLTTPRDLVGAGHPFEMMWAVGVMQFAMYFCAGLFHFAALNDEPNAKLSMLTTMGTTAPLVFDV